MGKTNDKLPSGFESREEYNTYMRDYRRRKKEEVEARINRSHKLMQLYKDRKLRNEMAWFIKQVIDLAGQPGLSDSERVKRIRALPISREAALLATSIEVVTV